MFKKKIDIRVELLSYINEKNQIEYYPSSGFPLEIFIINEFSKINLFTKENLNSSNYFFFSEYSIIADLSITLKKLLFMGKYTLYDQFSWELFSNFIATYANKKTIININSNLVISTIFLSMYLDIKIVYLHYFIFNKKLISISNIFSNAVWIERENSEMFNIYYNNLKDSRKLLLDYTSPRGVLLKHFNIVHYSHYYKNYYGVNYL